MSPETSDAVVVDGNGSPVTSDKISAEEQAQVALLAAREQELECQGRLGKVEIADVTLYADNPRPAEEFETAGIVESYRKFGYRPEYPITVSIRKDGSTVALRGNRRLSAALILRDTEPETFARVFPKGEIPALIHKGLNDSEEILLAVDHTGELDRKGLSKWGEFRAISALMLKGEVAGRYAIAEKLGLVKVQVDNGKTVRTVQGPYVQKRMELARLPDFVQSAFKGCPMFGGADGRFKQAQISRLLKLYNSERDVAAKAGTRTGPQFDAAWSEIVTPAAVEGGSDSAGTIMKLTRKQFADRAVTCKSDIVRTCMEVAAGAVDAAIIGNLDSRGLTLEAAERKLVELSEYYGEADFAATLTAAHNLYVEAHPPVVPVAPVVPALPENAAVMA